MGLDRLLGNQRLKENLAGSLRRGRVSHFYLLCGPAGSGKRTLAQLLAAAAVCTGAEKPCLTCKDCRKALSGTHPDIITVDDPEKKTVPVDLIRQARSQMYIRPNEAQRKVFLFPRGQDMGIPGQNALLKVLEEPPAYGVFIILTDSPEKMLPTVRSRCTELTLQALEQEQIRRQLTKAYPDASPEEIGSAAARSGGYLGQALDMMAQGAQMPPQTQSLVEAYTQRDALKLVQTLVPMEKWKRDQMIPLLEQWICMFQEALSGRSGMPTVLAGAKELASARSASDLLEAVGHLKKALEYTQSNVSVAAVCGYLSWALR